jgi:hypothetical protein
MDLPPADANFNYREHLARQGIHSQMNRPQIAVLAEGEETPFTAVYSP